VRHVPHGHFLLRVDRFLEATEIEVRQDERVLWRQRYRRLARRARFTSTRPGSRSRVRW